MGEGKIQKEETIEKDRKHQHPGCTHEGHTHESHAHSHAHEPHCGCGHDHAHDGDGHESHAHSHAAESYCGCGHDHAHDGDGHEPHVHSHAAESHCGCGHHHSHEGHHHEPAERRPENHAFDGVKKQIYIIENLGCANCAAKMERKIQELPQVDYANLIYATRQLQVVTNTDEELLPVFQGICASIEDGVTLTKQETKQAASERKAAEKEKAREREKQARERKSKRERKRNPFPL